MLRAQALWIRLSGSSCASQPAPPAGDLLELERSTSHVFAVFGHRHGGVESRQQEDATGY